MNPIRLLLVDDHRLVREGLKSYIDRFDELVLVAEADNGLSALEFMKEIKVDVVLLDIDMPGLNGIEVTKILCDKYPSVKILIISMHNQKAIIKSAIESGAKGFILKNTDFENFKTAVMKISAGENYFDSNITLAMIDTPLPLNSPHFNSNVALSKREIEILILIAEGYSNGQIGEKLFISHKTVDTHRTNMMKKLEIHSVVDLVKYAISRGLIK